MKPQLIIASIAVALVFSLLVLFQKEEKPTVTAMVVPETKNVSGPEVGPLPLREGERLLVLVEDRQIEITADGLMAFNSIDGETTFDTASISDEALLRLREDIGRLHSAWMARLAGENTVRRDELVLRSPAQPSDKILVARIRTDGNEVLLLHTQPGDPEYLRTREAFAPLLGAAKLH